MGKSKSVIHKNKIINENERIFISLNSKQNKAIATRNGSEYEAVFKNKLFNKIYRILFGSNTAQFDYYSVMKDCWQENSDMTKAESEKLMNKIKKSIDIRVYNVLKEMDSNRDSSSKRRMDYVYAMINVGERRRGESRREYKERCTFERNQALRRAKINIKYELTPNIKSLPIIFNAMKAKRLAGSSIKTEKIDNEKDEIDIHKTRRFKSVNFRIEDLKKKVSDLQFGKTIRKARFGAVLGVSAILGGVVGNNIVGPAIANNMANGFAVESDADTKSKGESEDISKENSQKTIMDIDKIINGDNQTEDKDILNIGKLFNGENQKQDNREVIDIKEFLKTNNEEQNYEKEEQQQEKSDEVEQQENQGKHTEDTQQSQNNHIEKEEKEDIRAQIDEEKQDVAEQPVQEDERESLKDVLMEVLNIGFDSEINNLEGKYYETPEQNGNYGKYKEGAKEVSHVDVIKDDGYVVIKPEDNMDFSEIKETYPDTEISYHIVNSEDNGKLGWNLSTENNIEEKMVRTALRNIKPYIKDDTEIMRFLCEHDMNSSIDVDKYKDELEKIKQAVKQYEHDNRQATNDDSQAQDEGR